jgi:PST family polysaccharide transporter
VLGAQVLLALFATGLASLVQRWVPSFGEHPALLWSSVFWALAQAFSLTWYYQGLERMRLVASLDISAKVVATAGIFLLVSSPNDGWKVLTLQGLASSLSIAVALGLAYREVPIRFPTPSLVGEALRTGWHTFISRSAISLYTVGNAFILGLFAPPQLVGYYSGAEKISTAVLGLLRPVNQALYPRLSHLMHHARAEAARLTRVVVVATSIGGALVSLVVFMLAPFLVRILLGPEFGPAAAVLRVLALMPPLVALSNALGIQWMLPLRLERLLNVILLGAGLLNLTLALVLAPLYAQLGMAWAVVAAELFVTVGIYTALWRRGLDPMTYAATPAKDRGRA